MQSGVTNEEIEVDLRLSFIKPLHATWLINLYNHLTSREGKRHIAKGWEKARLHCISDQRENPSSVMKIVLNTIMTTINGEVGEIPLLFIPPPLKPIEVGKSFLFAKVFQLVNTKASGKHS